MGQVTFTFRRTEPADLTYIKRLNYLTEVFGDETVDPDPVDFREGTRFYVGCWEPTNGVIAFDEELDNPAGAVWLVFAQQSKSAGENTVTPVGEGYVGDAYPELAIGVEKRYQHRGLGGQLLEEAAQLAAELDCPGLSLCVHRDNPGARRLYVRHGFEHVEFHEDSGYEVMLQRFTRP